MSESLAWRLRLVDNLGLTLGGFLLMVFGGIAVFCVALSIGIVQWSRAVGRTTCRNFSTQTGYRTKFVLLNFFDTGTCLAQAPNGRWVLNSKVLTFSNPNKP